MGHEHTCSPPPTAQNLNKHARVAAGRRPRDANKQLTSQNTCYLEVRTHDILNAQHSELPPEAVPLAVALPSLLLEHDHLRASERARAQSHSTTIDACPARPRAALPHLLVLCELLYKRDDLERRRRWRARACA